MQISPVLVTTLPAFRSPATWNTRDLSTWLCRPQDLHCVIRFCNSWTAYRSTLFSENTSKILLLSEDSILASAAPTFWALLASARRFCGRAMTVVFARSITLHLQCLDTCIDPADQLVLRQDSNWAFHSPELLLLWFWFYARYHKQTMHAGLASKGILSLSFRRKEFKLASRVHLQSLSGIESMGLHSE